MGIIETIFGIDNGKKIYRKEFEQAIGSLPNISYEEQEYLKGVFSDVLEDGITGVELKRKITMLEHNSNDLLNQQEVESVKRKLLGELEDNK